jgi:hypothetical protein
MDNFKVEKATDDDIRELMDIINDVETRLASMDDETEIDESDAINAITNILIADGLPEKDAHTLIYDDFEETEDSKSVLVPVYISTVAYVKVKDAPSIKDAFEVVDNTKDDIIKVNGLSVLPNTVEIIGTEEFVKQFNNLDTKNIKATDVEFK